VAGVAAEIVRRHFDAAFADRGRAHEIDRQAPEMVEARLCRGAFNRPANQRGRRAGVLIVGVPRAAGERARAKDAFGDFVIGCVQ
jgi:hypothetical protein